jgi:hypothetical protein
MLALGQAGERIEVDERSAVATSQSRSAGVVRLRPRPSPAAGGGSGFAGGSGAGGASAGGRRATGRARLGDGARLPPAAGRRADARADAFTKASVAAGVRTGDPAPAANAYDNASSLHLAPSYRRGSRGLDNSDNDAPRRHAHSAGPSRSR